MSHKQAKRDRVQARIAAEKQVITQQAYVKHVPDQELEHIKKMNSIVTNALVEPELLGTSYIPATYALTSHSGFLVENWKHGWKWISNIALTAIVAVNAAPIPAELIAALPPHTQTKVTIGLAVIGFVGRFINQHPKGEVLDGH